MNYRLIAAVFVSTAIATAWAADEPAKPAEAPAPKVTAPKPVPDQNEVVAHVNGSEIKRLELNAAVQGLLMQLAQRGQRIQREQIPVIERDILDELIGHQLLLQE